MWRLGRRQGRALLLTGHLTCGMASRHPWTPLLFIGHTETPQARNAPLCSWFGTCRCCASQTVCLCVCGRGWRRWQRRQQQQQHVLSVPPGTMGCFSTVPYGDVMGSVPLLVPVHLFFSRFPCPSREISDDLARMCGNFLHAAMYSRSQTAIQDVSYTNSGAYEPRKMNLL